MRNELFFICILLMYQFFQINPVVVNQDFYNHNLFKTDSIPELHSAVLEGDVKKVRYLLQKNNDVMGLDAYGDTALMYACRIGSEDFKIISALIKNGSSILYENPNTYDSAISICIDSSKIDVLQFLLNKLGSKEKENIRTNTYFLFSSIIASEPEFFELLIPYVENVNDLDEDGISLLEYAVRKAVFLHNLKSSEYDWKDKEKINTESSLEIISKLLAHGALMNENPMFSFVVHEGVRSPDVFNFLIENGLDLNRQLKFNSETYDLLDFFLKHIAEKEIVIIQNQEVDMTRLKYLKDYLRILDSMVNKGLKIADSELNPYQQLMILAVSNNNLQLVKLILEEKSIDFNFTDSEGKKLMTIAKEAGDDNLIDLLVKYNP